MVIPHNAMAMPLPMWLVCYSVLHNHIQLPHKCIQLGVSMGKLVIAKLAAFFLLIGRLDSITKQHRKCMLDCLKATRGLTNIESVGEQEAPSTKLSHTPFKV